MDERITGNALKSHLGPVCAWRIILTITLAESCWCKVNDTEHEHIIILLWLYPFQFFSFTTFELIHWGKGDGCIFISRQNNKIIFKSVLAV